MKNKKSMKLKSIAILIIAASVIFTFTVCASPSPYLSREYGKVSIYDTVATSSIDIRKGTVTTSFNDGKAGYRPSSVEVTVDYVAINTVTLVPYTIRQTRGSNYFIGLNGTRPNSNYRSWRVRGTHKVTYGQQSWTAITEKYY